MPVFWKSSSADTDSSPGQLVAVPPCPEGAELRSGDWAEIEDLLDRGTDPAPAAVVVAGPDPCTAVRRALAELRARADQPVLPAGQVSDRLIDIWDLAHRVDPDAAAPAASLMTALLHRDLASAAEVTGTCAEIEALLDAVTG